MVHTVKVTAVIRDVGECPMCGFDSLRVVQLITDRGTILRSETNCGRCATDLHDALEAL